MFEPEYQKIYPHKIKPLKVHPRYIASIPSSQKFKCTTLSSKRVKVYKNLNKFQWYEPPKDSGPVQFFENTSLHGLKYLVQRKRHISERIFWCAAFTSAMIFSTILIWKMWDAYITMPVITVFNPETKKLNQIPFPSVTVCNVNKIRKQKFEYYRETANLGAKGQLTNETMLKMFASVYDVHHICQATETFSDNFRNVTISAPELLSPMMKHWMQFTHLMDTLGTLGDATQSCEDMILYCLWLDSARNCTDLFQRVDTDYGSCCTFNMIPLSLLWSGRNGSSDDPERVKEWEEANINYDNILHDKPGQKRKYPLRQFYPGKSAGLSILLDPQMDEYHCTNLDSTGFVLGLNVPIDYPHMKDNGVAIRTGMESFVSVHPEITMSDSSAKGFKLEKRRCYFEGEMKLKHYTKYTAGNCMDECVARKTIEKCGCVRYYMPHDDTINEKVCGSWQYDCTENVREDILEGGLDETCDECLPACTDIRYHTETTSLPIWNQRMLKLIEFNADKHEDYEQLLLRAKDVSIVHVYFSVDSVFPRLRKEMTSTISLISNAGGLLGLCMGFSLLSLLEIVYHLTLRVWCNIYRKRSEESSTLDENSDEFRKFKNKVNFNGRISDNSGRDKTVTLPWYFQSIFDADFKKAYFATKN